MSFSSNYYGGPRYGHEGLGYGYGAYRYAPHHPCCYERFWSSEFF
uniref:Keratin associated protein 22-1 n=1 Tax=Ailuropoda melanoleuca TaxID=9646 RepID=A0A7N5P4A7_AILME